MAAGCGTRISNDINEIPKSTLKIGKDSLIRNTIKLFLENAYEVCIVVGYKKEMILKEIDDLPITVVYNPFYKLTNSIASLWFARSFLVDEETIIMNGDVYIEQDLIDFLLNEKRSPTMLVDAKRKTIGDFFFEYKNSRLISYGKELPLESRTGEYVGIAKLSGEFIDVFKRKLEIIIDSGHYNEWWEQVLYDLSDSGQEVYVSDIGNRFWSEIDQIEDYQYIQDYLLSKI
ncbi:Choline kinase [Amphibacillus marinus]|uniref:Choline kinase n=1 Tax=Amphibacillus marinus TaxID=872970 RepID=A0A1H8QZ64_9BACI|nr:phosphocholine cytidylyltransferase family protein [Amphibacillus marinus]SEO59475.1 Choline kinase [Amphibacillus marinus]